MSLSRAFFAQCVLRLSERLCNITYASVFAQRTSGPSSRLFRCITVLLKKRAPHHFLLQTPFHQQADASDALYGQLHAARAFSITRHTVYIDCDDLMCIQDLR